MYNRNNRGQRPHQIRPKVDPEKESLAVLLEEEMWMARKFLPDHYGYHILKSTKRHRSMARKRIEVLRKRGSEAGIFL